MMLLATYSRKIWAKDKGRTSIMEKQSKIAKHQNIKHIGAPAQHISQCSTCPCLDMIQARSNLLIPLNISNIHKNTQQSTTLTFMFRRVLSKHCTITPLLKKTQQVKANLFHFRNIKDSKAKERSVLRMSFLRHLHLGCFPFPERSLPAQASCMAARL